MKSIQSIVLSAIIVACSAAVLAADFAPAQEFWQTPALAGVGKMRPLPRAAYQPEKNETYKVALTTITILEHEGYALMPL
jgi:hypothetical protein